MPARVSSGTYYPALPHVKRQQLFPKRRSSIKSKTRLPPLTKSQSVLTQSDLATFRSRRNIVDVASDEDYEEPKSSGKRKRRTKFDRREANQSSMTQFDRGETAAFLAKRRKVLEVESDDIDLWQDDELEKWEADLKSRQNERARAVPWLRGGNEHDENVEGELEIPESSQTRIVASPTSDPDAETEAKDQVATLQTPKKVRFQTEVPSSQTPPSTKHSTETSIRHEIIERSPLKERSQNAQTTAANYVSPESQNTSMKMLERVRFDARNVHLKKHRSSTLSPEKSSPEKIKSSQEAIDRPDVMSPEKKQRQLQRLNTIQDSQVDDAGSLVEFDATPKATRDSDDDEPSYGRMESPKHNLKAEEDVGPKQQSRQLRRVTTIQDSQLDGSDALTLTTSNGSNKQDQGTAEFANIEGTHDYVEVHDLDDGGETFDNVMDDDASQFIDPISTYDRSQYFGLQSTYDPAFSALDRDAARFRWIQTQAGLNALEEEEEHEDSETDCEDLDVNYKVPSAGRVTPPVDGPLDQVAETLSEDHPQDVTRGSPNKQHGCLKATDETNLPVDQQSEVADERQHEVIQVPSSPPPQHDPPYPSQVSTAPPTQLKEEPIESLRSPDGKRSRNQVVPAPPFSIISSPQKTCSAPPEMPSSSPLPLPPWSSPRNADPVDGQGHSQKSGPNSDASLRPLADFSLPPPPPLSSGRSRK